MAREGFLVLDSDLHIMEPDDLWARYLDEPYRANPPRFFGGQKEKLPQAVDDKGNAGTNGIETPTGSLTQPAPQVSAAE
jgi:hypothetical protein